MEAVCRSPKRICLNHPEDPVKCVDAALESYKSTMNVIEGMFLHRIDLIILT